MASRVYAVAQPPGDAETTAQPATSAVPVPVHVPVHCDPALTHLPLEQLLSATQRHAVWVALQTGAGVRVDVQVYEAAALPDETTSVP
jgi:hypothetical protein